MIPKFSVKKPYTVFVGVVIVIVLGIVSLTRMTADLFPNMNLPYALIITTDVGAAPEEVEKNITAPIEAQMATTSNIKTVTSNSSYSFSMVILEYEQTANMDSVVIEIQQKLDQIKGGFPKTAGNPIIMQLDPSMLPIIVASADVDGMDQLQIGQYAEDTLVPNIEAIEGVASVSVSGTVTENIQVTVNEKKVEKLNDKIIEKIDEKFDEARQELEDGKEEIEKGEKELNNGKKEFAERIADGGNQIINGKIGASVGESELKDAKTQLETTKKTLDDTTKSMAPLKELYDQAVTIENGIKQLNDAITQIDGAIAQFDALLSLPDEQIMAATGMSRADIEAQKAGLVAQKQQLETQRAQAQAGLDMINKGINENIDPTIRKTLKDQFGIDFQSYKDIPKLLGALTEAQAKVNTGIEQINEGQKQITEGKSQLDDAYVELKKAEIQAIFELCDASSQLAMAKAAIEQGEKQIDDAYDSAIDQADLNKILTVEMVSNLIMAQNFEMPAGYVQEGDTSYLIKVGDEVRTIEDFENLILLDMKMDGIDPIYLSDVADIIVVNNADDSYARINGNPAVIMSIEKQTGYATNDIAKKVLDRFKLLEKNEDGLHLTVLMNQGVYIDIIVKSVVQDMLIGALLAVIILVIFLKDFRSTFVIACSIPLSVVFAIVLMYFTGITLNIISLSGLALGIGMLVDNSIVVIENIYRLRKEGLKVKKASVIGTSQVAGAIIASTLTTVCVFAPIVFTNGITKQLFVDLALTVVYTLAASLIVALTFVPMMSSVVLKNAKESKTALFDKVRDAYGSIMYGVIKFKPLVFLLVIVLLAGSIFAGFSRGFSFVDMDMETDQISLTVTAKEDEFLTEEELREQCDKLNEILMDIDGIDTVGMMIGGGTLTSLGGGGGDSATVYIILDEDTKRKSSDIAKEIEQKSVNLDCAIESSLSSMDMSAMFGSGLSINLKGRDIDKLQEYALQIAEIVEGVEGTVDVDPGLGETTTSLTIHVDKEKAMDYQMTVAQVYAIVMTKMMDTSSKATISTDIKDYDVFIKNEEQSDVTLNEIKNLTFKYTNEDGEEEDVKLAKIVTFETGESINTIRRSGQSRFLTISAGIADGYNVTQVSSKVQKELEKLDLAEGYTIKMAGEDETIMDAMKQLALMLLLAVIFIYLVMVAQFQSFLSPFIIMFTIPLAFTGGLFALFFTKNDVSVIGAVGFVMLAGIIVNNGIVMVDYINQLRQEGYSKKDAIVESCKSRLRPILMTALTTIISMIPMALGLGDGSEMMQPMAIVMIGGLVYGTILTLFVVPCVYDLFNRNKDMRVDEYGESLEDEEEAQPQEALTI